MPFEAALRSVRDPVVLLSRGRAAWLNRAAEGLLSQSSAQASGRLPEDLFRLVDPSTGRDFVIPPSGETSGRFRMTLPGGTVRVVGISARDLPEHGGPWRLIQISDDTSRTAVEEALRNCELLFRGIVENSFDGIYILRGRRYEYVNPRFCEITGYSYGELTAESFDYNRLLPAESRTFMERRFESRRDGTAVEPCYRMDIVRRDGTAVVIEACTVSIGRPGQVHVLGMMRDITDRVRAEDDVRESGRFLAGILSAMDDAIFRFDSEGRFLFVNSSELELLMPPGRFIGRHYSEILPQPVSDLLSGAWGRLCAGIADSFDYTLDMPSGLKCYRARLSPVMQGDSFQGVVSVVSDITAQVRAAEEQKTLEEQLERSQRFESLGMLAGGIAHDFNNLLMGILGNADLLREDVASSSAARNHLNEIELSSRRAADLCRQMLTYAGRGTVQKDMVDLSSLIGEISDLLRINLPEGVALRLDLPEGLPRILGDPAQLSQIVVNLVTNSIESLGDSDGSISVSTSSAYYDSEYIRGLFLHDHMDPGCFICLEVSDTGVGIPRERKERIFDPFFSTKGPGRGLGLAAVLGIARGHGGSVKVYSEENGGTTIKVLLPAVEDSGPAEVRVQRATGSGAVLVVDDEELVRNVLQRMLEKIGYGVCAVSSGLEAVRCFRRAPGDYAFVVLDLAMPGMDGREVLDALRRIDAGVKVIIASGYSRRQMTEKFGEFECDGFIQKPFRMDRLSSMIASVLGEGDRSRVDP